VELTPTQIEAVDRSIELIHAYRDWSKWSKQRNRDTVPSEFEYGPDDDDNDDDDDSWYYSFPDQSPSQRKHVFALLGIAGSGKTTVVGEVARLCLDFIRTPSDRPLEPGLKFAPDHSRVLVISAKTHAACRVLQSRLDPNEQLGVKVLTTDAAVYHHVLKEPVRTLHEAHLYLLLNCDSATVLAESSGLFDLSAMERLRPGSTKALMNSFHAHKETPKNKRPHADVSWRYLLSTIRINEYDWLEKVPREYANATLFIDEASMLSVGQLADAKKAYARVVLVGDPIQLPNVTKDREDPDERSALDVKVWDSQVDLQTSQRQLEGSTILRLADRIRRNDRLGEVIDELEKVGLEHVVEFLRESRFKAHDWEAAFPIITHTNHSRRGVTQEVRSMLGFRKRVFEVGEPLLLHVGEELSMCYAEFTDGELKWMWAKDRKFRRQARFFISVIDENLILLQPEEDEDNGLLAAVDYQNLVVEWDTGDERLQEVANWRFAYAITAHTAQGNEWPAGAISYFDAINLHRKFPHEYQRWIYTALTRFKEEVFALGGRVNLAAIASATPRGVPPGWADTIARSQQSERDELAAKKSPLR
jgi:AAA domain-containing protein/UvrD-like helicase family protein